MFLRFICIGVLSSAAIPAAFAQKKDLRLFHRVAEDCAKLAAKPQRAVAKCEEDDDGPSSTCAVTVNGADQAKLASIKDDLIRCLISKGLTERSAKDGFEGFTMPKAQAPGPDSFIQIGPWQTSGTRATLKVDAIW